MSPPVRAIADVAVSAARTGRIEGGWEFVWAVYLLTWVVMGLYAVSLWIRRPRGSPRGSP